MHCECFVQELYSIIKSNAKITIKMFKIHCLFTIIVCAYLIKFSGAEHNESQTVLNYINFEKIKINLFTRNRTTAFDYKVSTSNDEECSIELSKIGSGVKKIELWAIKRKFLLCSFFRKIQIERKKFKIIFSSYSIYKNCSHRCMG